MTGYVEEAPMWLLLPCAVLAWLTYLCMVLSERRQHREVDDTEQGTDADSGTDQPTEQGTERRIIHDRIVAEDIPEGEERRFRPADLLPGGPVPSVAERLDRWQELS